MFKPRVPRARLQATVYPPRPLSCNSIFDSQTEEQNRANPSKLRQKGDLVEYWSYRHRHFLPAVVTHVRENGAIQIDIKPGVDISIGKQKKYVRDRVLPRPEDLSWTRGVIEKGRLDEVANTFYYQAQRTFPQESDRWTRMELLHLGCRIDRYLGTSGHGAMLWAELCRAQGRDHRDYEDKYRGKDPVAALKEDDIVMDIVTFRDIWTRMAIDMLNQYGQLYGPPNYDGD